MYAFYTVMLYRAGSLHAFYPIIVLFIILLYIVYCHVCRHTAFIIIITCILVLWMLTPNTAIYSLSIDVSNTDVYLFCFIFNFCTAVLFIFCIYLTSSHWLHSSETLAFLFFLYVSLLSNCAQIFFPIPFKLFMTALLILTVFSDNLFLSSSNCTV